MNTSTPDLFIHIPFTSDNLDRYVIRTSIKNAILHHLPDLNGALLDAGCGKMPYKELITTNSAVKQYIGLDIASALTYDQTIKPDYTWDGKTMPFEDARFDCCIATEVLEHCPEPEVFMHEVWRVLKPGGIFFFTVPFLWNLHEVPHDEYRYTPFSMERHLKNSGFTNIAIKATGGWHAAMAQMMGLWVRRAPISVNKKKWLSRLFKPIIRLLIIQDKKYNISFTEGQMITGLYGIARK